MSEKLKITEEYRQVQGMLNEYSKHIVSDMDHDTLIDFAQEKIRAELDSKLKNEHGLESIRKQMVQSGFLKNNCHC